MQILRFRERGLRIVCEQWRNLERNPSIDAASALVDRPEKIRRLPEILQREIEEQRFSRLAFSELPADGRVIVAARLDREVENRRVRREAGDRELVDISAQRAARQ